MKRALALILALVMTMALVACGGDKATTSTKPGTSSTPSTTTPGTSTTTPGTTTEQPAADPDAWKYGGTFIAASSNATTSLDPTDGGGSLGNSRWMHAIFEGFLMKSVEGVYYPRVCDFEESPDGKVVKLTLREGRYFSNGKEITIDDVWASLDRYAGQTTTANWDKYFKDCEIKREGSGKNTCYFRLK